MIVEVVGDLRWNRGLCKGVGRYTRVTPETT